MFSLALFWNAVFDPTLSEQLRNLALESLARLSSKEPSAREEFIQNAGTNIVAGVMLETSLEVLHKIGFTSALASIYGRSSEKFESFIREYKVIGLTIPACARFHSEVLGRFPATDSESAGSVLDQPGASQGMTAGRQARLYVEFLHECCTVSDNVFLSPAEMSTLWRCYVTDQISEEHSNLFWETLMKEKKEQNFATKKYGFFNSVGKGLTEFFDLYLANDVKFQPGKATSAGLKCFRKYFEIVNDPASRWKLSAPKRPDILRGVDTIWKLAIEADSAAIRSRSADWIIEIFFDYLIVGELDKKIIVQSFLQKAFKKAHEFPKTALSLLQSFILKQVSPI